MSKNHCLQHHKSFEVLIKKHVLTNSRNRFYHKPIKFMFFLINDENNRIRHSTHVPDTVHRSLLCLIKMLKTLHTVQWLLALIFKR